MIYKHIMIAMDDSEASDLALKEAIRLTEDQQATLKIMYILDKGIITSTGNSTNQENLWNAYKQQGKTFLDRIKRELIEKNIAYETHLVELSARHSLAMKILEEASSWGANIMVLGTHGRKGISRLFRGSVTESVLRIATIPVLVVRKI
jgi:nucleotide-binding universal stress UspA family protein